MGSLAAKFDVVAIIFFIIHIPITVFLDSQAVFPAKWYPAWAIEAQEGYLTDYGDPLMRHMPPWFAALCWIEIFVQLPFFFVAAYGFWNKREWIRTPAKLYGVNVASTMVPILAELILSPATDFNRPVLLSFYIPFMILPLAVAVRCLTAGPRMFPEAHGLAHSHQL